MTESLLHPTNRPGYDRAALERYFADADAERVRLAAELAQERARLARYRTALDARRVLGAMVEQAVDEVTAKRRQRDLVVQRVVGAGDPDAAIRWQAPMEAVR